MKRVFVLRIYIYIYIYTHIYIYIYESNVMKVKWKLSFMTCRSLFCVVSVGWLSALTSLWSQVEEELVDV